MTRLLAGCVSSTPAEDLGHAGLSGLSGVAEREIPSFWELKSGGASPVLLTILQQYAVCGGANFLVSILGAKFARKPALRIELCIKLRSGA
jgi:hypothetical protein